MSRPDLAALRKGDRVTVLNPAGMPTSIAVVRGLIRKGSVISVGAHFPDYYSVADGKSIDRHEVWSIRPWQPRDEERVAAGYAVATAEMEAGKTNGHLEWARDYADRKRKEAREAEEHLPIALQAATDAEATLTEMRSRLAAIDAVPPDAPT